MFAFLRQRGFLLLGVFLILVAIGMHIYFYIDGTHALQSTYFFVKFMSNHNDYRMKELDYKVYVKNKSNRVVHFHVVIERLDAEWYPYLSSIPQTYYSEALTLGARQGEYYTLKTTYQSEDDRITGGSFGDLKVKFISPEEYKEILSNK